MTYLCDKNTVALGLADATTAIVAYETETSYAGRANLPMQTGAVRNPFQRFGANSTAVIHGFFRCRNLEMITLIGKANHRDESRV